MKDIYKTSLMLAVLVIFGSFAINFSQTGSFTGNTVVVRYAYLDHDADGYGDPNIFVTNAYRQPAGYVTNNLDCDDNDGDQFPGAVHSCEAGVDNDCNGIIDYVEDKAACDKIL